MCGIFAILNNTTFSEPFLKTQFETGQSRGPENSKFKKINNIYFGFHRLAINGLGNESNQPFEQNDCVLICNGEIYNYKKLYSMFNITPNTMSDCEIIIHLYLKFGMEYTLQLLDGCFAFCLYDNKNNKFFIARDMFGLRPMYLFNSNKCLGISSELKQLVGLSNVSTLTIIEPLNQVKPSTFREFNLVNNKWKQVNNKQYYYFPPINIATQHDTTDITKNINIYLTRAVRKRIIDTTDRPVACLLSGGLDSSLITSIVSRFVQNLETFSIGMPNSVDLEYAKKVSKFLGTNHKTIQLSEDEFFNAIPKVIKNIESYDTTTVRASVGNYLVSKYISENSDAKVIFNGDGSDELTGGYLYFHKAPNEFEFDRECKNLLANIYKFDVQRSDRSISSNGLEPRTPFLDREFVNYYLSIPPHIRCHNKNTCCEKILLREAFNDNTYLPKEVLFRTKEAFSDGVSGLEKSWYEIISEKVIDKLREEFSIINIDKAINCYRDSHNPPTTPEQLYYRKYFDYYFPNSEKTLPYFWMPKYVNAKDSSARSYSVKKE